MENLIARFRELFVPEPQKSFRKLGITDEKVLLTIDGTQLFINWLFEKHATEFNIEVVDKLLAELEEGKK